MKALSSLRDGVLLEVRLVPGARRQGIEGLLSRDDGRQLLKVKVSAPPEGGKANAALLALLARALKKPKRDLLLVAGAASREKKVKVLGEPKALEQEVAAWLAGLPTPEEKEKREGAGG